MKLNILNNFNLKCIYYLFHILMQFNNTEWGSLHTHQSLLPLNKWSG